MPGSSLFLVRGKPLTRPQLVSELRAALEVAGLEPAKYAGHSFRIGAATTAAACGVPVDVIKTLGRWPHAETGQFLTALSSLRSLWDSPSCPLKHL